MKRHYAVGFSKQTIPREMVVIRAAQKALAEVPVARFDQHQGVLRMDHSLLEPRIHHQTFPSVHPFIHRRTYCLICIRTAYTLRRICHCCTIRPLQPPWIIQDSIPACYSTHSLHLPLSIRHYSVTIPVIPHRHHWTRWKTIASHRTVCLLASVRPSMQSRPAAILVGHAVSVVVRAHGQRPAHHRIDRFLYPLRHRSTNAPLYRLQ